MASLSLPAPRNHVQAPRPAITPQQKQQQQQQQQKNRRPKAPSYEERCRTAIEVSKMTPEQRKRNPQKLFVPRSIGDFDDGGAYPEIHVAQYPRHMGNPLLKRQTGAPTKGGGQSVSSRAIVNIQVDKDGEVSYDAIVKGGTNSDKIVYSRHEDMVAKEAKEEDIALPTQEEERKTAERTQAALQALLSSKTQLDKPSGSAVANAETSKNMEAKTQFIKYTPNPDAPGYNPSAAQRVIQMVPKQVDPMMPPKHKHVKAPRGPAEDPVPVLHAPPTKLTKEERDAWNIPACISNWKNTRGYTIPLDKRLAADGRGLREHTINSNFATLSESLYVAERQARQEVRLRAQVQKKLAIQEKDRREEELRNLANQARLERGGAVMENETNHPDTEKDTQEDNQSRNEQPSTEKRSQEVKANIIPEETDEDVAARQRERLRMERKREREREMRMEKNMELKKKKLEEERDVSEKIALGVHQGTGGGDQIDSRLYNQTGGMDSGFGADDEYNTYSKPLFGQGGGATSSSIYRPTRGETAYNADEQYEKLKQGATSKFVPDKGFAGAQGDNNGAGSRTAPVQFEKGR